MKILNRPPIYFLRLFLFGLLVGAALLIAGYLFLYVRLVTMPLQAKLCCQTPADFGLDYWEVHMPMPDGVALSGWYVPSQNGAVVVLLHGDGGTRLAMLPHAVFLARHGFGVLMYDQRACGESQGEARSYGWLDAADLGQVVAFAQQQPEVNPERVGVLGVSLGGQIAVRAAAQTPAIRAVVSEGTGMARAQDIPRPRSLEEAFYKVTNYLVDLVQWGYSGVKPPEPVSQVVPRIAPRPLLLIAAGQAEVIDDYEIYYGNALYALSGEPKTLWVIPESTHGSGLQVRPAEYEQRVIDFFEGGLSVR